MNIQQNDPDSDIKYFTAVMAAGAILLAILTIGIPALVRSLSPSL